MKLPSSLEKVVLQPPVPACLPDPVPTGRRGLLLVSPATLSAAGKQRIGRKKPAEAVSAWGWGKARSEIPEAWIPVTAETRVEFTEFSPVLEVKRTDLRRSRGRP